MSGFWNKMKSLRKSKKADNEEKKPVAVERDNIYQSKINDVVIFGFNDLMELANQQFEVVGKTIYERESEKNMELLTMISPSGDKLFVDNSSDKQHIYVYKEMFLADFSGMTTEDEVNREEYLDGTEDHQIGLKFNSTLTKNETSDFWIQNDEKYYGVLRAETFKHITDSNSYNIKSEDGILTLVYMLESSDREYRMIITIDQQGNTFFFSGRRIEPHDVDKIMGED
jgi:hypothetical protein